LLVLVVPITGLLVWSHVASMSKLRALGVTSPGSGVRPRRVAWQPVTIVMLIAVLLLPRAFAAPSPNDDECGKGETKTDQGCAKVPRLTHKSEPVYPADARRHHVEGSVTLQGRVNETGTVDNIKVLNSQWRYRPGTIDGKPVPVYFTVTMDFVL